MNAEGAAFVAAARMLSEELLAEMPERLRHCRFVAVRAAQLCRAVPASSEPMLVAAAWLHDIGHATAVRHTGFHPLDGAEYLANRGAPAELAALVAHHSGARFVAEVSGFPGRLARFEFAESPVNDALTYADQTVGLNGQRMTVSDRIADALRRHGPDSPNAKAIGGREPYLYAAAARVEHRLAATAQPFKPMPFS